MFGGKGRHVALEVDDRVVAVVWVELCEGGVYAIGTGMEGGVGEDCVAPGGGDGCSDFGLCAGDGDGTEGGGVCDFKDVEDHGAAGDKGEGLSGQAGGRHSGRDKDDWVHGRGRVLGMGAVVGNMDGFVAAAVAAVEVAGAAIRPWFRVGLGAGLGTELKDDASPVTVADRAAEQAMRAVLVGRFPEHGLLGEEFGLERAEARFRWVLDPIDGTRAFITGRPVFGTLVALLEDGVPVVGVIDQPVTGERWVGVRGRRTVFAGGAGAVGCRAVALEEAELSCTAPEIFSGEQAVRWGRLAGAVRRVSWGGDCYAYGLLALGCVDVVAEAGLKVWDWAALVPVIEGAGGSVTDWGGGALRADGDGTVLAVGDRSLVGAAVGLLS